MSAGYEKCFNGETYIWAIKTFFQLCICKDKTFKLLPVDPTESGANTISHVDQIPIEQEIFKKNAMHTIHIQGQRNLCQNDSCYTI